ncbi:T9SS type A sorting domain-containing protein [Roseivirga sp. E12]|uniref:T9SS type A sorting domain-containing protein n=1 Tax=Roseivirga sp. E12 TaxID=2819237 RepID=UPI001ABBEE03|nr:T9SS type A sorting domain-containing protein [Roseivirga sp. E12]MBO3699696.1 T9SS type A sorting domain-containing protein [Roseivirga sp. E12]
MLRIKTILFSVLLLVPFMGVAQEPTTQASGLSTADVGSGTLTLSWTRGNGGNIIILAKSGSAVDANPSDNTTYTADRFSLGTQIGTGNYVVYIGTGTSTTIRGLSASTTYHFAAYEFNTGGSPNDPDYLLTSVPTTSTATTAAQTYYSFQNGNAESPGTWTTNSSGVTLVNSAVPSPVDDVVILANRTVTISENDFDVNSMDVNANGTLDLGATNGHTFTTISGTGLMRSTAEFPGSTTNDFVTTSGGTFEYYNAGTATLTTSDQTTYNNLIFDNSDLTLGLDLTVNGTFTLENDSDITIGDDATVRNITWSGNVTVDATSSIIIRTGVALTEHNIEVGADFTNSGSVRFTAQVTPSYTVDPSVGVAIVTFTGAADNVLVCNGTTDFYRLIVNKGTDKTFLLTVSANATGNFELYGTTNDNNENTENPNNVTKALWIRTGTLKLNTNIEIFSLTEGTKHFYVPSNGGLWIDGATVALSEDTGSNGGNQGIAIYGLFRLTSGTVTGGDGPGINYRGNAEILIEGGTMTLAQFRRANSGSTNNKASYTQTGGTVTFNNDGRNNGNVARFDMESTNLSEAQSSFTMTNGTLIVSDANSATGGISIQTRAQDFSVTGGTIIAEVTDANNFGITVPGPLYNLTVREDLDGATADVRPMNDGIDLTNLEVQNDLVLDQNVVLNMDNDNLTVGGNFTINSGTTYTPGTNTTTFNGSGTQTLTIEGTVTTGFDDFTVNKSTGTFSLSASSPATITVIDQLTLTSGTFDDNGKTIAVAGNVVNSATHSGSGSIQLNGANTQTVSGDGSGIFQNLTLFNTNAAAAPVSTSANMTINGTLTFSNDKLFNIGTNNLALGTSGVTSGQTSARYIQTAGNASDGGITKTFSGNATAYVLPVGTSTDYLPATYTFTASGFGSITVKPLSIDHPILGMSNTGVGAYWVVSESGWTSATVTHTYDYPTNGSDASYRAGRYLGSSWTDLGDSGTPGQVIEGSDQFTVTNVSYFEGEFTAADAFSDPLTYYARANGDWGTTTTWSTVGHGGAAATGVPGAQDVVLIGDGGSNNYTVTAEANIKEAAALTIASGSTLNLAETTGHIFSTTDGTGTLRIAGASFPSGDFTSFLGASGGTVEYFNTGTADEAYTIPDISPATFYNLTINTGGQNRITTPDQSITVFNDMTIGSGTDLNRVQTSQNASGGDITINGDLTVQSGGFLRIREGATAITRNIIIMGDLSVEGDIRMNNTAVSTGLTMTIHGNVVNNGSLDLSNTDAFIRTVFTSAANTSISGTGGTTEFASIEVDKGTSATSILEVTSSNFAIARDPGLTLTNGTFRLTTATTITASSTTLTIPSTAALSANGGTINIATGASNANDLTLNGELEIITGTVNIGTSTNANNNDIEYASIGTPTIDVQGGTLFVNGQIRRSAVNTNGSLTYTQSGGTVTINGRSNLATRAKLEVANSGVFNMSGSSTLNIVRGGGTTFDDLHLRPGSSTVSGGAIVFAPGTAGNQAYTMDANVTLNNLTITGNGGSNTATLDLDIFGITLNGALTLSEANSVFDTNGLDVTIGGDLTNSGTYTTGSNTTTFNGTGAQAATFNTTTAFNNFVVNKSSGTLTLGGTNDATIAGDLTLTSGTMEDGGRTLTITGNVTNNATHTSGTVGTGGISFTDADHNLTGTGPFGNITLNGTSRTITVGSATTINGDLDFNGSVVYSIGSNALTFGDANTITGSGFSGTKMIRTSSNNNITKNYPASASNFTFPVGISTDYTPVTVNLTANSATGSVTLALFNEAHPLTTDAGATELLYYYRLSSTGLSGVTSTLIFNYVETDVQGAEGSYFAGRVVGGAWTPNGGDEFDVGITRRVNDTNNTITYTGVSFVTGDFTAGETAEFGTPQTYYSRNATAGSGGGNWETAGTWTFNSDGTDSAPLPSTAPAGNNVTIRSGHEVTITANSRSTFALVLEGTLNLVSTLSHTFGDITGSGELTLEATASNNFSFPSADISGFTGTVNYTGDTNDGTLINTPDGFSALIFTGTSAKNLANVDLDITGDWDLSAGTVNQTNNTTTNLRGDFNNTGATFNATNGTFIISGTGAQNIITSSGSSTFNNLTISNTSATVVVQNNITVNGTLTQDASNTLDMNASVISGTGSAVINGSLTTSNANGLSGGAATAFANTLSSVTIGAASSITYDAAGAQTVTARTDYNNMGVGGSGTKSMDGALTVGGILNISAGDLSIGSNLLTLNGTITGAGTITGSSTSDISVGGTGALGTIDFTTGGETLGDFTINRTASGTVDFEENFTIRDNLTLTEGFIRIAASTTVTLGFDGSAINIVGGSATSYIDTDLDLNDNDTDDEIGVDFFLTGNDPLTIPLGYNPYRPVVVSCSSGCSGARYTLRARSGPYTNPTTSSGLITDDVVRSQWRIRLRSGTAPVTVTVRITWDGTDEDDTLGDDVGISIYDTNLPSMDRFWDVGSNIATKSGSDPYFRERTITLTGTSRVYMAVTNNISPLPVTLVSFTGELNNSRNVELNWQTAAETDNNHFVVQRSINGADFTDLDFVAGNGDSDVLINYSFVDDQVPDMAGNLFYRLKQVDFSGSFEYSPIISVAVDRAPKLRTPSWKFFPNPTNGDDFELTLIDPSVDRFGKYLFQIIDARGRNTYQEVLSIEDGVDWVRQRLKSSADGIYILLITTEEKVDRFKVIKK